MSQISVPVICCPACGDTTVRHKGHNREGSGLVRWECMSCDNRWKGTAEKAGRAIIVR